MKRPEIDELTQYRYYVRKLARRHSRDETAAEDLEQQTWLRVLRTPPVHGRAIRAWLARIVHNLAAATHRTESRYLVGSVEERLDQETPFDITARRTTEREVDAALEAVAPSYRDVLRLRFYDGLTPREIADLRGLPVNTVYTRLRRGLEGMRPALETETTKSRRCGALVPLFLRRLIAGDVSTVAPLTAFAGLLIAATAWFGLTRSGAEVRASATGALARAADSSELPIQHTEIVRLPVSVRPPTAAAGNEAGTSDVPHATGEHRASGGSTAALELQGIVLDPEGRPVAGAEVWASAPLDETRRTLNTTTDAAGRFRTSGLDARSWVDACASGLRPSKRRSVGFEQNPRGDSLVLRLRIPSRARVRVLDSFGQPIEGAALELVTSKSASPRVDREGQLVLSRMRQTFVTEADGIADLRTAVFQRCTLSVTAAGFEPGVRALELAGRDAFIRIGRAMLEIRLEREQAGTAPSRRDSVESPARVRGMVIDELGQPVSGALILARDMEATEPQALDAFVGPSDVSRSSSGPDGSFELVLEAAQPCRIWVYADSSVDRAPVAVLENILPNSTPVRICTTPSATAAVRGRVEGTPRGQPRVLIRSTLLAVPLDLPVGPRTGEFAATELPPGDYAVTLCDAAGVLSTDIQVALESGRSIDLGLLASPSSAGIRISFVDSSGPVPAPRRVGLTDSSGRTTLVSRAAPSSRSRFLSDSRVEFSELPAGDYVLVCSDADLPTHTLRFELKSGVMEERTLELRPGTLATLQFTGGGAIDAFDIAIVDSRDQRVFSWPALDSDRLLELNLLPGDYELQFELPDGATARMSLTVGTDSGIAYRVRLDELFARTVDAADEPRTRFLRSR